MKLGDLLGLNPPGPTVTLHHGNCLELMRSLPTGSVDAVVTDPPYGLRFMGKRWDYDVPSVELWAEALRVLKDGGRLLSFGGTRTFHRIWVNIEDAGFTIEDSIAWMYGSGFPKHRSKLKPAMEPICVARKGDTSELSIDDCRVAHASDSDVARTTKVLLPQQERVRFFGQGDRRQPLLDLKPSGRWPANVILDEFAAALLDAQQEGASRFFYVAKPSRDERNKGLEDIPLRPGGSNAKGFTEDVAEGADRNKPVPNPHPTVKPITLMQYLVRLVTNEGGTVLDPFMGTGTTGIGCKVAGRNFIGMELDPEEVGYVEIARRRIEAWQ